MDENMITSYEITNKNETKSNNKINDSLDNKQSEENTTNQAEEVLEEGSDEHLNEEIVRKDDEEEIDVVGHEQEDSLHSDKEEGMEGVKEENDEEKQTHEQEVMEVENQKSPEPEQLEEEEEGYVEEPPPDPTAPFDLSDSKEALKPPFELRPDQVAEVEQLWEVYQNYTPAYTDIDGYITEKELVYMLKSLLLMTHTPEQLQELIAFCVRPSHPQGHINYEQFLKMVTMRQRDFPVEDELRSALQVYDPGRTGLVDREYLKEVLAKQGHKMPQKQLDNLIKEVDIANDGTIGIEDVVGTMCIDLNKEDLLMLKASLYPPEEQTSKHSL